MERLGKEPLKFTDILGLTLTIVKENLLKLFLLILLLTGPLYLVIALLYGDFSLSGLLLDSFKHDSIYDIKYLGIKNNFINLSSTAVSILTVVIILLELIAVPLTYAAIMVAVNKIKNKEKILIWQTIKDSASRYFAIVWGTFVFYFLVIGFSFILGFVPYSIFHNEKFSQGLIPVFVIGALLLGIILLIVIKLGFYYAVIVIEKIKLGFVQSWELTQEKFLRLIGLYVTIVVFDVFIIMLFKLIFGFLSDDNFLYIILYRIVKMILVVITVTYYTVIYFDAYAHKTEEK